MGFENSLSFRNCGQWCPVFSEIKLFLVFTDLFSSLVSLEVMDVPICMETAFPM